MPATKTNTRLVKIHPYNPKQGYHCKRHIHPPYVFREDRGWYEVDNATAKALSKKLNNPGDPHSRPVFIVATHEEAEAMQAAEEEVVARPDKPVPLPFEVAEVPEVDEDQEEESDKEPLDPEPEPDLNEPPEDPAPPAKPKPAPRRTASKKKVRRAASKKAKKKTKKSSSSED